MQFFFFFEISQHEKDKRKISQSKKLIFKNSCKGLHGLLSFQQLFYKGCFSLLIFQYLRVKSQNGH